MKAKLSNLPRKAWLVICASLIVICSCLCVVTSIFLPNSGQESNIASEATSVDIELADSESAGVSEETEPSAQAEDTAVPEPSPVPSRTPKSTATAVSTEEPTEPAYEIAASVPEGDLATVVEIVDGDTIKVEIDGATYNVRYIGMDTPERGAPFFAESTEANRHLVEGQRVILVKDISETDRYNRLLRYIYLLDGTFVNAELVRLGFAQPATYPPDVAFQDLFAELQIEAREAQVGLWAATAVAQVLPTATPIPQPTNTAPPQPTTPEPTNTAVSQPTSTALPLPTNPPPSPQPTATPIPAPTDPPAAPAQVVISSIFYNGVVDQVESDEYAIITNVGGSPVNLAGWRLNADDNGQDFWFPSFDIQPGQSCRVYTNEIHPDTCGFSFNNGRALWANSGECGHLFNADGAEVPSWCY